MSAGTVGIGAACSGSVRLAHSSVDGLVGNLHFLVAGRPVLLRDDGQSSKLLELIIGHQAGGGAATESINGLQSGGRHSAAQRNTQVFVPFSIHVNLRLLAVYLLANQWAARERVESCSLIRCRVDDGDKRALDQEVGSHVILEAAVVRTHRVRC
jgi:hypothetical protein